MAGLGPTIALSGLASSKTWMLGTRAGMTEKVRRYSIHPAFMPQ